MKTLLFTIFLMFSTSTFAYMLLPIVEVYDGDTIKTDLGEWRLPEPLNEVSVRIRGIDTPEVPASSYRLTGKLGRAKCNKEAAKALEAKLFLFNLIKESSSNKMKVTNFEWDSFGRILGDVKVAGIDVGKALIDAGLAVPYDGSTETDWCK